MTSQERVAALTVAAALSALTLTRHLHPARSWAPERLADGGAWVEVQGAVDRPGLRPLAHAMSLERVLRMAGARCRPDAQRLLRGGELVRVERGPPCRVRVGRLAARARLTLGLPLDPNRDGVGELALLPGIGNRLARAIVDGRPYGSVDELDRVRGIGPKTLARLRRYLMISSEIPEQGPP